MPETAADRSSSPEHTGRATHLSALDGVRAVAAFGVIATHAGFNSGRSLDDGPFAPFLARLDFGVTLFFLLSGFLLYQPFAAAAVRRTTEPDIRAFWWRRALRVFPAYWVAVAVTLALLSTRTATPGDWLNYLLMTQTYDGHNVDPSLTQMWTLAVEISFYALLPVIVRASRRLPRARTTTDAVRTQVGLLAALAVTALAANITTHLLSGDASAGLLWLPVYLDWFALGMALALLVQVPEHRLGRARVLREYAAAPATCWVIGGLLFWLATLPVAGPRNLLPTSMWEWTIKHYLYGAAAFCFLLPLVAGATTRASRVLGSRPARWLGVRSYGIYLWHLPILLVVQRAAGWRTFDGHFVGLFVITAVVSTVVAALSWRVLERPLLRRWSSRWRPGQKRGSADGGEREQAQHLGGGAVGGGVG